MQKNLFEVSVEAGGLATTGLDPHEGGAVDPQDGGEEEKDLGMARAVSMRATAKRRVKVKSVEICMVNWWRTSGDMLVFIFLGTDSAGFERIWVNP
jgi:hypothetical protein